MGLLNKKEGKEERGVSPVVATVLLIAIVVVMAIIVFVWFNQISQDVITKFGGENIELVCMDVMFSADYNSGTLSVVNDGNVPIFGMKIKMVGEGSHSTEDLGGNSGISDSWPDEGLNQGGAFSDYIGGDVDSGTGSIVLIPVLKGTSEKGERTFVCDEKQTGYELDV